MTHVVVLLQVRIGALPLDPIRHRDHRNGVLNSPEQGHRGGSKGEERPRPAAEVLLALLQVAQYLRHHPAAVLVKDLVGHRIENGVEVLRCLGLFREGRGETLTVLVEFQILRRWNRSTGR